MRSPITFMQALLSVCVFTATLIAGGVVATPAAAQDRGSQREGDRGDSSERRRGGWGSRWRDRSEGDRDRDERRGDSERESSDREADDSPGMTPDSYAKGLIDKRDKNDNKVLDGDELTGLTGPASAADFNKDGFISGDEIVASLAKPASKPREPPSTTSKDLESDKSGSKSNSVRTSKRVLTWTGGGKPSEESKSSRRTYRFTPARERLPSELPSWFKSQDKNGDGQVAMSEYSRSWTKSTVAKFQGYDSDGDGVVTAKEVKGKK